MATGMCALAKARLARAVATLREPGMAEKAGTAAKAGFVGTVGTVLKAGYGNASWGGLLHLAARPTQVAVDYIAAVGQSARTGFTVNPLEFRTLASALDADGLRIMGRGFTKGLAPTTGAWREARGVLKATGGWQGVRDGLRTFAQELDTRLDAEFVARTLDYEHVRYKSPTAQALVDGAFAVLEAADRPFYQLAFDSSLYAQAKLLAMKERAPDLKLATARWFEQPTDEMLARATDDAMYATFKDRNALSRMATDVKRGMLRRANAKIDPEASPYERGRDLTKKAGANAASFALDINIPFTGVPSSVIAKSAAQSPLGVLALVTARSRNDITRQIALLGVGAAGWKIGWELHEAGRITTGAPQSAAERALWDEQGKQPWSVLVNGRWWDARALGPFIAPAFMGAKLREIRQDRPDQSTAEAALTATAASARFVTEQTYLQNLSRLVEATKSEKRLPAVVASQVPVPSVAGQIARATDPMERQPETIAERLKAKVPGLSQTNPARQTMFGRDLKQDAAERVGEFFAVRSKKAVEGDRLLTELERLQISVGMPARALRMGGKTVQRSRTDYRALMNTLGPATRQQLDAILADPEYPALTDEQKAAVLERAVRRLRTAANEAERARLHPAVAPR